MDASAFPACSRGRWLTLLALIFVPALAASESLSLREIWALGLGGNPELVAAGRDAEASEFGLRRARADYAPSLSLFSRATRYSAPHRIRIPAGVIDQDPRDFDIGTEWAYQLTVVATQDVSTGGATRARVAMAEGELAAGRGARDAAREDLLLDLTRAVFEVERARSVVDVALEEKRQAEGHVGKAVSFLENHLVTRLDVLEAQGRLADVERKLLSSFSAAEVARARLNRLLGRPLESALTLADATVFDRPIPPLAECRRTALERRPALASARGAAVKARGQEEVARSQSRPRLSLFGSWTLGADPTFLTSDTSFWNVGATVTWSLFDAGRRRADVGRAAATKESAAARLRGAEEEVALEVLTAHRSAEEKDGLLRSLEVSVEAVRERLRLARERYAEGLGRGLDVLDAQTAWARTETELRTARLEVQLGRARLLHAMGVLSSALSSPPTPAR